MKDLDFDELDRAVNSLMSGVPKSTGPASDDGEKTLTITPTLDAAATPSLNKLNDQAAQASASLTPSADTTAPSTPPVTTPARSSTPLAARRGGRFMDVVHPSSDMKKPTLPPRPASREGVTITPTASAVAPDVSAPVVETDIEKSLEASASKPEEMPTEHQQAASEWPDPLEIADFKPDNLEKKDEEPTWQSVDAPKDEPVKHVDSEDTTESHDKMPSEEPKSEPAPLTSPFLADAKVEKRPLGSAALAAPVEEPEHTSEGSSRPDEPPMTVNDPNDQLPARPSDLALELPEELRGDLMAIESDTTHDGASKTNESTPTETDEEPKNPLTPEKSVAPKAEDKKTDIKAEPTGPTSIPQQYREEPSTGDQNNGAIYDTDTYHQPLAHPAKKKSGWMWVIWIIVILLVGAGGGAALYFSGII